MSKKAADYFYKSTEILKNYKNSKAEIEEILKLTNEFNEHFNAVELYQKIMEFVEEGKKILLDARIPDLDEVENNNVEIIKNKTQFQDWFAGERGIKILLK